MFASVRPDYSHPSRFLASLGVGLIAFGLAVPWLVGKATSALLISQNELDGLSPAARSAVTSQQEQSVRLLHAASWVMVAALVVGLALVVWGLIWWTRVQRGAEKREIEKHDHELHYTQASDQELDLRLDEEASGSVDIQLGVEQQGTALTGVDDADVASNSSNNTAGGDQPQRPTFEERRAKIKLVESAVTNRIEAGFELSHKIIRGAHLEERTPSGSIQRGRLVDILLVPLDPKSPEAYVVDIKYVAGRLTSYSALPVVTALNLALASETIRGDVGRGVPDDGSGVRGSRSVAAAVLVIEDGVWEPNAERIAFRWNAVNGVLRRPVAAVFVAESELFGGVDVATLIQRALTSGVVVRSAA